jgi:hypothetical protein
MATAAIKAHWMAGWVSSFAQAIIRAGHIMRVVIEERFVRGGLKLRSAKKL